MPTIYWVGDSEGNHHLSLSEAMKEAREVANERGFDIEVIKHTLPKLDLKTFVSALNDQGWSSAQETAAIVKPRGKRK